MTNVCRLLKSTITAASNVEGWLHCHALDVAVVTDRFTSFENQMGVTMNGFAKAVFGLVVPETSEKCLYTTILDNWKDGDALLMLDNDVDRKTFNELEEAITIKKKLGMPDSAAFFNYDDTDEDAALPEGSLLLGWGVLQFPQIATTDEFKAFLQTEVGKKCEWFTWVVY